MMAKEDDDTPQVREPEIVHGDFCSGIHIENVEENFVRLVGYTDLGLVEDGKERRIVVRIVISSLTARTLLSDLRKALAKGGH